MKRFGVMLDMSRNAVMKVDEVKKLASVLKSFGYNMIQLYTEDTYEVQGEPYFGYLRGRYSESELRDIVSYCDSIGVEVIPCIQTLAHLGQIFRWKDYSSIRDIHDILLTDDPRTYEFIENMFSTLSRCFTSRHVHIGMDEAHLIGRGAYMDRHGKRDLVEVFTTHLNKVVEIAERHGFTPQIWSDMFFRLENGGNYYPENPVISEKAISLTPKNVGLVYWDYYNSSKEIFDTMFSAHEKFGNEIWFTGGAWTWLGFAPSNHYTMHTMIPAMQVAKEHGVENVAFAMWGDDGKETSFYAVLPSLFALKKIYDGETDMEKIKAEFNQVTGEHFDDMMALDLPHEIGKTEFAVGGDAPRQNPAKHMLYSDPFLGALDATVKNGGSEEYKAHARTLWDCAKRSKKYGYIFELEASLCDLMAIKYDLGVRTRDLYKSGDREGLLAIVSDYDEAIRLLKIFTEKNSALWFKENKPQGYEIQDFRVGGLSQRLLTCKNRLLAYLNGAVDSLPELEESILDWWGGRENVDRERLLELNSWAVIASTSVYSF